MNHQPFRDWLFTEENLDVEQSSLLHDHLKSCEACQGIKSAWIEVESTFHKVPQAAPPNGFTARWQLNLAGYHARKQRVQGWLTIGITGFIVISIASLLIVQIWTLLKAPGPYLAAWFSRIVDLLAIYFNVQHYFNPIDWNIPIFTFTGLFFLVGIASFISVLWLAMYRKLSLVRRVV